MALSGVCLCGAVRIHVSGGPPTYRFHSHAEAWRASTGAPSYPVLGVQSSAVRFEDPGAQRRTQSGDAARAAGIEGSGSFCGSCGTPLSGPSVPDGWVQLSLGLFNQRGRDVSLQPTEHAFCSEAVEGVLNLYCDGLPRHAGPPSGCIAASTNFSARATPTQELAPALAPAGVGSSSPEKDGPKVRLQFAHEVDENSQTMKDHGIISVPQDAVVILLKGTLEAGMSGDYGDYVEVDYNGKIGKISRKVAVMAMNQASASSTQWAPRHITVSSGLSASFDQVPDVNLGAPSIHLGGQQSATPAPPAPVAPPTGAYTASPGPAYGSLVPPPAITASGHSWSAPPTATGSTPYTAPAPAALGMVPPQAAGAAPPAPPPALGRMPPALGYGAPPNVSGVSFMPSPSFQGERPGYAFKNGAQGVGYYAESPSQATAASSFAPALPAAAAPAPPAAAAPAPPAAAAPAPPAAAAPAPAPPAPPPAATENSSSGPPGVSRAPPGVTRTRF